jgi:hypothetical protein
MMRWSIAIGAAAFLLWSLPSDVRAQQTETDRLREAIRSMTAQLRSLEDQRTQMQAKLTQTEREKLAATQRADRLTRQLKDAQDSMQKAVEEFNQRLADRDETLDRWKTAYNQAADVAREKDALRAKFEAEASTFKARTKSCEVKNAQLRKVSSDILAGYRDLNLGDAFVITEPMIGIGRVGHQNRVQDFRDRILDQDVKVPLAAPEPPKTQPRTAQTGKRDDTKPAADARVQTRPAEAAKPLDLSGPTQQGKNLEGTTP